MEEIVDYKVEYYRLEEQHEAVMEHVATEIVNHYIMNRRIGLVMPRLQTEDMIRYLENLWDQVWLKIEYLPRTHWKKCGLCGCKMMGWRIPCMERWVLERCLPCWEEWCTPHIQLELLLSFIGLNRKKMGKESLISICDPPVVGNQNGPFG